MPRGERSELRGVEEGVSERDTRVSELRARKHAGWRVQVPSQLFGIGLQLARLPKRLLGPRIVQGTARGDACGAGARGMR